MDDEQEVVKLLESLHESLHNGEDEGEEDSSQRPVGADVDTPQEGGGEDSGLTSEMAEGEERDAREELQEGYQTLQLLHTLLDDGKSFFRSHFRPRADTEVPSLPPPPNGAGTAHVRMG